MGDVWESISRDLEEDLRPNISRQDKLVWKGSSLRNLSIKEAYKAIRGQGTRVPWSNFVWFKKLAPRHSFILWLVAQQRLVTMDKLVQWGGYII